MKLNDFLYENGKGSSSKLWFNLHNVIFAFIAVFCCFRPNQLLIEMLATYGSIVHGSRLANKLVASKWGSVGNVTSST